MRAAPRWRTTSEYLCCAAVSHLACSHLRQCETLERDIRTVKRPLIGDIVDQQNPHSAPVVCCRDGAETLLPGRVPDLKFHPLAIELNGPNLEINANRGDE